MTTLTLAVISGAALAYGYRFPVGRGDYWMRYIGWLAAAGLAVELVWP